MSLTALSNLTLPAGIERTDSMARALDGAGSEQGTQFRGELGKAIDAIDTLQGEADAQASAVARGAGNIHEMMLALEKADVAMRLAMRIRNKIVDTYNDIMKMGI